MGFRSPGWRASLRVENVLMELLLLCVSALFCCLSPRRNGSSCLDSSEASSCFCWCCCLYLDFSHSPASQNSGEVNHLHVTTRCFLTVSASQWNGAHRLCDIRCKRQQVRLSFCLFFNSRNSNISLLRFPTSLDLKTRNRKLVIKSAAAMSISKNMALYLIWGVDSLSRRIVWQRRMAASEWQRGEDHYSRWKVSLRSSCRERPTPNGQARCWWRHCGGDERPKHSHDAKTSH